MIKNIDNETVFKSLLETASMYKGFKVTPIWSADNERIAKLKVDLSKPFEVILRGGYKHLIPIKFVERDSDDLLNITLDLSDIHPSIALLFIMSEEMTMWNSLNLSWLEEFLIIKDGYLVGLNMPHIRPLVEVEYTVKVGSVLKSIPKLNTIKVDGDSFYFVDNTWYTNKRDVEVKLEFGPYSVEVHYGYSGEGILSFEDKIANEYAYQYYNEKGHGHFIFIK